MHVVLHRNRLLLQVRVKMALSDGVQVSLMLPFQRQSSSQTLADGIAEFHTASPQNRRRRSMSAEAQEFFRCHDAVHVMYGCGTTLDDEAVVKIASIFGTTAGIRVLRGYRLHESRAIYAELKLAEVFRSVAHSTYLIPRTIFRCSYQKAPWPWQDFDNYLSVPLGDTRTHFGIHVAH